MKKTDMGNSIISRVVPVLIRENKRKRRIRAATGVMGVVVVAAVMLALASPGFTADPPDRAYNYPEFAGYVSHNDDDNSDDTGEGIVEYGRAYQASISYTYDGRAGESAYLRFNPLGKFANSATVGGEEVFCLQSLTYSSSIGSGEVQRLSFGVNDDYNYYPYRMQTGETVMFNYKLYFQHDVGAPDLSDVTFEVIQARNSASIIKWNIIFENGIAYPFDDSSLRTVEFYDYDIPHYIFGEQPIPLDSGSFITEDYYSGYDTDGNAIGFDPLWPEQEQSTDETSYGYEPVQEEQNIDETTGAYGYFQAEPSISDPIGSYDSTWEGYIQGINTGTYDTVWEGFTQGSNTGLHDSVLDESQPDHTGAAGYDPFWHTQQPDGAGTGNDPYSQTQQTDETGTAYDPYAQTPNTGEIGTGNDPYSQTQQTDETGTAYDPYVQAPNTDGTDTAYAPFRQESNASSADAGFDTVWQGPYIGDADAYDTGRQGECMCDYCGVYEPTWEYRPYICENCGLYDYEWAESDMCENCRDCEHKQQRTYVCENCGAYKKPA